MKTYILILTICSYAGGGWGGHLCNVKEIEFNSLKSCQIASQQLSYMHGFDDYATAQCVEK